MSLIDYQFFYISLKGYVAIELLDKFDFINKRADWNAKFTVLIIYSMYMYIYIEACIR